MNLKRDLAPMVLGVFMMIYPMRGGDTLGLGFLPSAVVLLALAAAFLLRSTVRFVPGLTDVVIFAYLLLCFATTLNSGVDDVSMRYLMQILALSIFPYFVIRVFGFSLADARRFLAMFPYITILAAAGMLVTIGPGQILSYAGFRLGTEALNPVGVGSAFGLGALLSIAALRLHLCNTLVALLAVGIATTILVLSGSRGPMLALAISFVAVLAFGKSLNLRMLLGIVAIGGVGYYAFGMLSSVMVADRFQSALLSASVDARQHSWAEAIRMFDEKSVLGHGLGAFEALHGEYVHNVVLEHMANGGFMLTIPFLAIIIALFGFAVKGARQSKTSQLVFIFAVAGIFSLIVRQFSLSMANTKEFFLFLAMAIGCAQDLRRGGPVQPANERPSDTDAALPDAALSASRVASIVEGSR